MKLLFIHHRLPYPLMSGRDKVTHALLRALATRHDITLLAPVAGPTAPPDADAALAPFCRRLIAVPVPSRAGASSFARRQAWLARWIKLALGIEPLYVNTECHPEVGPALRRLLATETFDAAQVADNIGAPYLFHLDRRAGVRILGPVDDYVHAALSNRAAATRALAKLTWALHARARARYDARTFRRCERLFFHSPEDLERTIARMGPLPHARVLRHPVEPDDVPGFDADEAFTAEQPDTVLFVGGLGSAFNTDAVRHFLDACWPAIRAQRPAARFMVVGQRAPAWLRRLAAAGDLDLHGDVPDVRPFIRRAAVCIAPVRAGTGIKTKAIEALALGKALVAYPAGIQGLGAVPPDAVSVATTPAAFAAAVSALLADPEARRAQAHRARALYETRYAFNAVLADTLAAYDELPLSPRPS